MGGCGDHHMGHDQGQGSCGCGGGQQSCCCGGENHGFQRKFKTKAEKLEMLKNYQHELEQELTAVKEKIAHLSK
jgi:hypothetical protein